MTRRGDLTVEGVGLAAVLATSAIGVAAAASSGRPLAVEPA
jgi:hypothetical protein